MKKFCFRILLLSALSALFLSFAAAADIRDAAVEMQDSYFYYTGGEICPVPVLTMDGETLREGTDYTLTYRDNIEVGTASVTIDGIGEFSGSLTRTYEIYERAISDADCQLEETEYPFTFAVYEPAATLTFGGRTLVEGEDYELYYGENKMPGNGVVYFRGIGSFSGWKAAYFTIKFPVWPLWVCAGLILLLPASMALYFGRRKQRQGPILPAAEPEKTEEEEK